MVTCSMAFQGSPTNDHVMLWKGYWQGIPTNAWGRNMKHFKVGRIWCIYIIMVVQYTMNEWRNANSMKQARFKKEKCVGMKTKGTETLYKNVQKVISLTAFIFPHLPSILSVKSHIIYVLLFCSQYNMPDGLVCVPMYLHTNLSKS